MADTYRVTYERRNKPKCKCCTDDNHPWIEDATIPTTDLKQLHRDESSVWGYDNDPSVEIRNVKIIAAQIEWKEVQSWELPNS